VRRLSDEQVAKLVDRYQAGATINALAKHFEIHRTTVSLHLLRQGVRDSRRRR
jgi:transposase-like protein